MASKPGAGSRASSRRAKAPVASKTYSWGTMVGIAINYAMGTGILGLPHAIASASLGTSLIIVLIGAITTMFLAVNNLEAIGIGWALVRGKKVDLSGKEIGTPVPGWRPKASGLSRRSKASGQGQADSHPGEDGSDEPLLGEDGEAGKGAGRAAKDGSDDGSGSAVVAESSAKGVSNASEGPDFSIPNNEVIENCDLSRLYFGTVGFYVYECFLIVYLFGGLWCYASVIASSLTSVVPLTILPSFRSSGETDWICEDPCKPRYFKHCEEAYWIWTCVGMFICACLIFVNVSDQKILQVIFTVCRFAVIGIITVISGVSYFIAPYDRTNPLTSPPYVDQTVNNWAFDFVTFGNLFSSLVFCFMVHHSIPGIVSPVHPSNQKHLNKAWYVTFVAMTVVTVAICFVCGPFFGGNSADLVTLNLVQWDGVNWDTPGAKPWWATTISLLMRVLPPIWVTTSTPLNALTLANNIKALFGRKLQSSKWVGVVTKLLASIPPFLLGGLVRCLGVIISFTGLTGFVVITMPGLMALRGRSLLAKYYGEKARKTPYSDVAGHPAMVWTIVAINSLGFVVTLYALIMSI